MAVGLAACGDSDDDDAQAGDTNTTTTAAPTQQDSEIAVAAIGVPDTLDPHSGVSTDAAMAIWWRIYEGLYDVDTEGKLRPVLAAGPPERVEPTVWEVKLRPDVKFSDGSAFDAEDAAFSINRVVDPDYNTELSELSTIAGAEVVDPMTIRVMTKEFDFLLPNRLTALMMVPSDNADFVKQPVGTGPYTLVDFDSTSSAVIERNDAWWNTEKPSVKRVTVKFIPDATTRVQALQAGDVDMIPYITADEEKQAPAIVEADEPGSAGVVKFDPKGELSSDVRIRQALNYAIDKDALIESVFPGVAEASDCQIATPGLPGRNDDLEPYPYDPEKAKQLVKDAGAVGKAFKVTWPADYWPDSRLLGEAIRQYWDETGLKIEMTFKGYNGFLKDAATNGEAAPVDALYAEGEVGLQHGYRLMYTYLHGESPFSWYTNPEVAAIVEKASTTLNDDERPGLFAEANKMACEDAALGFILYRRGALGVSEGISYKMHRGLQQFQIYYDEVTVND